MFAATRPGLLDHRVNLPHFPVDAARRGPEQLLPIKAVIHPLRDGAAGGQFMAVTLPDGTQFGNVNAAPSANAGGAPAPAR